MDGNTLLNRLEFLVIKLDSGFYSCVSTDLGFRIKLVILVSIIVLIEYTCWFKSVVSFQLNHIGSKIYVEAALSLLSSPFSHQREAGWDALEEIFSHWQLQDSSVFDRYIGPITTCLRDETESTVRNGCLWVLHVVLEITKGFFFTEEELGELVPVVHDADEAVSLVCLDLISLYTYVNLANQKSTIVRLILAYWGKMEVWNTLDETSDFEEFELGTFLPSYITFLAISDNMVVEKVMKVMKIFTKMETYLPSMEMEWLSLESPIKRLLWHFLLGSLDFVPAQESTSQIVASICTWTVHKDSSCFEIKGFFVEIFHREYMEVYGDLVAGSLICIERIADVCLVKGVVELKEILEELFSAVLVFFVKYQNPKAIQALDRILLCPICWTEDQECRKNMMTLILADVSKISDESLKKMGLRILRKFVDIDKKDPKHDVEFVATNGEIRFIRVPHHSRALQVNLASGAPKSGEMIKSGLHSGWPIRPNTSGQAVPSQGPSILPAVACSSSLPSVKPTEDVERRSTLPKLNVGTCKTLRIFIKPRIGKPEEPQGGTEMPEVKGSNNDGKPASSHNLETQGSLMLVTNAPVLKLLASSTSSELQEESLVQCGTTSDVATCALKKSKASDFPQEGAEGQTAGAFENVETHPAVEERSDAIGDLPQGSPPVLMDEADKTEANTEGAADDSNEGNNLVAMEADQNLEAVPLLDPTGERILTGTGAEGRVPKQGSTPSVTAETQEANQASPVGKSSGGHQ
ncbi:hypothetical protein RHGRI_028025 [Rhododendron griersonianum]|uniref:ARM repeat superfamily protein n=1 Tax=Rhododendron griersonianum TaxID=479676 RepID=A0AAV6IG86_9ERIC|nr:hypothetical protein RHGRI_028025 [Rhododendron griersonianum]